MSTPYLERDPCPDRILDDLGAAFAIKGTYNSPNGARIAGGMQAVRMNAPWLGGSFAVWGGLFSVFDCTMVFARQKQDPWNSIAAGAATHGSLYLRRGLRAAARSAVIGGCLLALCEGIGIMANHVVDEVARAQRNLPPVEEPGLAAAVAAGGGGPQGSGHLQRQPQPPLSSTEVAGLIFGEKVEEAKKPSGNGGELESLDTDPIPWFAYK